MAPMPYDPAPEVAVLPMRGWVRRKSLEGELTHPKPPQNTL